MIKFHEIQVGDIVMVEFDGQMIDGEVTELSRGEKKVCVAHGEQEFWYDINHLHPVPLTEEQLIKLDFEKVEDPDQNGKGQLFVRGPFSLKFLNRANDNELILSYRDEHRHLVEAIYVHQLQNHYKGMTNHELTRA
jgi:hypothetical protein